MRPEEEIGIRERADAYTYQSAAFIPNVVVDNLDLARADRRVLLTEIDKLRADVRMLRGMVRAEDDMAERQAGNRWRDWLDRAGY